MGESIGLVQARTSQDNAGFNCTRKSLEVPFRIRAGDMVGVTLSSILEERLPLIGASEGYKILVHWDTLPPVLSDATFIQDNVVLKPLAIHLQAVVETGT